MVAKEDLRLGQRVLVGGRPGVVYGLTMEWVCVLMDGGGMSYCEYGAVYVEG